MCNVRRGILAGGVESMNGMWESIVAGGGGDSVAEKACFERQVHD